MTQKYFGTEAFAHLKIRYRVASDKNCAQVVWITAYSYDPLAPPHPTEQSPSPMDASRRRPVDRVRTDLRQTSRRDDGSLLRALGGEDVVHKREIGFPGRRLALDDERMAIDRALSRR
jgi:hypothetical protein